MQLCTNIMYVLTDTYTKLFSYQTILIDSNDYSCSIDKRLETTPQKKNMDLFQTMAEPRVNLLVVELMCGPMSSSSASVTYARFTVFCYSGEPQMMIDKQEAALSKLRSIHFVIIFG